MRNTTLAKTFVSIGLIFSLALLAVSPVAALAQPAPGASQSGNAGNSSGTPGLGSCTSMSNLSGVVRCVVGIVNTLVTLMVIFAVAYVIYGAFLMITSEEKRENGKQIIYHGIIGLFVMISVWGLVNILANTFTFENNSQPQNLPRFNF